MPKSKHSEPAIIAALQQVDAGTHSGGSGPGGRVSTATIYGWKAEYGGMDIYASHYFMIFGRKTGHVTQVHWFTGISD